MLLDASAWIELFRGTDKGKYVDQLLSGEKIHHTSMTTLAEISSWSIKERRNTKFLLGLVGSLTKILPLSEEIAEWVGGVNIERKKTIKKWGMMDSFVLATAIKYNMRILTKDSDFEDLPNVEML